MSPIQTGWVPPNCHFEIEDVTKPWTFAPNHFDFVHVRYLYGSIPDWDALFKEAYWVIKPDGWIESDNNMVVPGPDRMILGWD